MERDGNVVVGDNSSQNVPFNQEDSILSSNFFLDHVGEVVLAFNSDGLSWKLVESLNNDGSSCLGIKLVPKSETAIKFSGVYAVEFIGWGLVHESVLANAGGRLLGRSSEMYRFTVHGVQRSKTHQSLLAPSVYTFGHKDMQTCQMWVNRVNASLSMEADRPKSLLVFVHPRSGKGNGCITWEAVAPIFSHAKVKTKVIVTKRAGHAFDTMASITNRELNSYDGVVAVGGDGFFNEILNGILLSRHKAPYPPSPRDSNHSVESDSKVLVHDANGAVVETSDHNEDQSPLLLSSGPDGTQVTNFRTEDNSFHTDRDPEFSVPNAWFRFGIIPAGSTDAIVICTTGTRDPITSALYIVLGKRMCLDLAQVVRWKTTSTSKDELEPCVRYAASFAGYGFYGDVITESEKYRWMGPKRYDYAGTKVFLRHRAYEAEVAYLEVTSEKTNLTPEIGPRASRTKAMWGLPKKSERVACRAKCNVCNTKPIHMSARLPTALADSQETQWLRSKGRFLSIGAAVISCRNERAPDGLVADAHLSDGFLHLILIRDCPHAFYLWHLMQLAKKGGNPLDFEFVEHHKTTAFTFTSFGKESVWNVDGELFQAHKLSAQVFRGLVSLFASGPEV
ncbi:unnamed protein product [Ilex paraguariensis]|uniref:DAGKc domain-containing protein n=1 Tax=Ilex paraguariensis TaxID=185542 RepID=A0ABC8QRV7_9AQUA